MSQPATVISTAPGPRAAAGAVDAVKIYGIGDSEVRALDGVTVAFEAGKFTAIMGPSGSGKSTLMHCLAGLDSLTSGAVYIGDTYLATLNDKELTELRRTQGRLHLPGLQPDPDAHRPREHHAAADARRRRRRQGVDRRGRHDGRAGRPAEAPSERAVRRPAAARRRGARPGRPAGHHLRRRADGQPRLAAPAPRSSTSCAAPCASTARPSSWSPTTRAPRRYADRVVFLDDGRIVDEMADPTAERVLDRMKAFGE